MWDNIRCNLYDDIEEVYFVEADDEDGEAVVLAKVDLADKSVEYVDYRAEFYDDVQCVIEEFLENGYVLTE